MAKVAGSLVVRVGADTTGLRKGGRQAESTIQRMGRQARTSANSMAKVGAAATAAGAAITAALTQRGMEAVTAQQRMAKALGTTNREVAGLTAAFKTYKLEQDDVADALGTLADRANDATNGMTSMAEDFELVGLQVDDLKNKRPAELFRQFSGAIQDTEDPTKRTAAAVRIFGDDLGRKLLPLLMRGPDALKDFREQADELGIAVNRIEGQQVERANKAIEQMYQVLEGVSNQLAVALAPLISEIANRFTDAARETGGFRNQIEATVKTGLYGFGKVANVLRGLQVAVKTLEVAFAGVAWVVNQTMGKLAEAVGGVIDYTWDKVNGLTSALSTLPGIDLPQIQGSAQNYAVIEQLSGAADRSSERVARLSGELGDLVDKPMPTENIDQFFSAVEARSREAAEAARRGGALDIPDVGGGDDGSEEDEENKKYQRRLESLRNYLQTRREVEMADHQKRMETLREWAKRENMTEQEFRKRKEELESKHQKRLNDISTQNASYREQFEAKSMQSQISTVAGGFEQMLSAVRNQSKAMFRVYQASAIANTIMSTIESANQAYKWGMTWGGPPLATAFAGAAYATGMARVAAISSQSFNGGGGGGGGGGGVANSTSGGQSVQQTSSGDGGGGGGGPQTVVNLEGETFGKEQVRNLLEELNEDGRDGGQITVRD